MTKLLGSGDGGTKIAGDGGGGEDINSVTKYGHREGHKTQSLGEINAPPSFAGGRDPGRGSAQRAACSSCVWSAPVLYNGSIEALT